MLTTTTCKYMRRMCVCLCSHLYVYMKLHLQHSSSSPCSQLHGRSVCLPGWPPMAPVANGPSIIPQHFRHKIERGSILFCRTGRPRQGDSPRLPQRRDDAATVWGPRLSQARDGASSSPRLSQARDDGATLSGQPEAASSRGEDPPEGDLAELHQFALGPLGELHQFGRLPAHGSNRFARPVPSAPNPCACPHHGEAQPEHRCHGQRSRLRPRGCRG